MAAIKIYAVGGLLLILTSPLWLLLFGLTYEREVPTMVLTYRLAADEWGRWLGVLAVALSMLQAQVNLSRGIRTAVALLFILGSVLIPYGMVRGRFDHPEPIWWLGSAAVATALVANLLGVLRFPPKVGA